MDIEGGTGTVVCNINYSPGQESEEDQMIMTTMMMDLRRGPWTAEEDLTLINYISKHGEGRWNSLARFAGLKRTGKSCRLRWLNYLRPDVRRGNITLQEQLLILELHSRWGNRWSKIAQRLPGRTDNEIKNYWRTRVQKHAKQLKCDVNSKQFKDTLRYLWMPRLVERIQAAAAPAATNINLTSNEMALPSADNSSAATSSDSFGARVSPVSDFTDYYIIPANQDCYSVNLGNYSDCLVSPSGCFEQGVDFQGVEQTTQWSDAGDTSDNGWNVEDILFLQQKISNV